MNKDKTLNLIHSIYEFNKNNLSDGSSLLNQKYNDKDDSALSISEMLKGFENLDSLAFMLEMDKDFSSDSDEVNHPEFIAQKIISIVQNERGIDIEDSERLNKHLNSIIFNFGSIFKLGLSSEEVFQALSVICTTNKDE